MRDNRIIVRRDWEDAKARLAGAFAIARDLAALAQPAAVTAWRREAQAPEIGDRGADYPGGWAGRAASISSATRALESIGRPALWHPEC